MNIPEAGYCSGCGQNLGLEPIGEVGVLTCPLCKVTLSAYRDEPGTLFDCGQCGGQFVEHPLLRHLLHQHEHAALPGAPRRLPAVPDPRNSYVACPVCAALMNRKNFGAVSGVIVDVCQKHGTWFDLGELPRVLAFVAAGGLDRTRRRAEEEAAESRRAAHAAAMTITPAKSSHELGVQRLGGGPSLAQMFVDLLLH
jgi:Zn-finger nucleic acid-binding protein